MHLSSVGSLYHPDRTQWPETPHFLYRNGACELLLFFDHPTEAEIQDIRRGECSYAFAVIDGIIFFIYKYGNQPMGDSAFTVHLVDESERTLPPALAPEESSLIMTTLVSANDGIIRAMRQLSPSHAFMSALYDAIREQLQQPFDPSTHQERVNRVYAKYSTADLFSQAKYSYIARAVADEESRLHLHPKESEE